MAADPIKVMQNELCCVKRNIDGCDRNCLQCDLVLEDSEIISAYEAAIEALKSKSEAEKYRTPKNVIKHLACNRIGIEQLYYDCPTCRGDVRYLGTPVSYCEICGQAVNWPDE